MNTQQRMDYILNNNSYIQAYMDMHDQEVKARQSQTAWQKFKGAFKWQTK